MTPLERWIVPGGDFPPVTHPRHITSSPYAPESEERKAFLERQQRDRDARQALSLWASNPGPPPRVVPLEERVAALEQRMERHERYLRVLVQRLAKRRVDVTGPLGDDEGLLSEAEPAEKGAAR